MENKFSVKDRLKELREKKGVSRHKLSRDLNVSRTSIIDWETGRRTPNIVAVAVYAEYFDVSIDYLAGRTNNPKVNDPIKSDENS